MLCTECKKEQEKRIPNEEKENAQPGHAAHVAHFNACGDILPGNSPRRRNDMASDLHL